MSGTNSKNPQLPNFGDLKMLNDLLENLEKLKNDFEKILQEKNQVAESLKVESLAFSEEALIQSKLRLTLEFIEQKIGEMRNLEKNLWLEINQNLENNINNYFTTGGLKAFIQKLLDHLNSKKINYTLIASPENSRFLPPNSQYENYHGGILRIETEDLIYIFDLEDLKVSLKQKLLNKKLPLASTKEPELQNS